MRTNRKKYRPYTYVGVDLSLTSPGVCWGREGGYTAKAMKMPGPAKFPHPSIRYEHISQEIIKAARIDKNTVVAIEDYAFGAGGKTFAIAENGGIFKHKLIYQCGVKPENIILVATAHVKIFGTGKGNSPKDVVIKEVYKRFGFDTSSNDEADAFVLWKIAMNLRSPDPKLVAFQLDAIKRVRKYNGIDKG